MLYGIFVTDNYKQRVFERRFYHYFYQPENDSSVIKILKNNLEEIVDLFGADTLTNDTYSKPNTAGIFAGVNVITALHHSSYDHINYFMHFLFEYPGKYIGNDFRFSEIYATWIINNTPLIKQDIKDVLLKAGSEAERKRQAENLASQMKEHNIADDWLIEGLKYIGEENIAEAGNNATLLNDAGGIKGWENYKGWSNYLAAQGESKNDNTYAADSLLKQSFAIFNSTNDQEGKLWARGAMQNLKQSAQVKFTVQTGHIAPYEIAMSPNPRYFATGSEDFLIKIWDINQAKEIRTIAGHTNAIRSIAYSPDGKYLASAALDTTIRIWNAFDYSLIQIINTGKPVTTVRFTPDGKQLVTAGRDSLIRFWDPVNGRLLRTFPKRHKDRITDIYFNPVNPNRMLSSSYDSLVLKWDVAKGDTIAWFREKGRVLSVKLSNDGKWMSTVSTDHKINVWDYENFKRSFSDTIATHATNDAAYYSQEAFSPDSRYLVYASDKRRMRITDLNNLKYSTHTVVGDFLSGVFFSNDGNFLIQKFFAGGQNKIIDFSNWDFGSNLNVKDWKQYSNPPMYPQFSYDGKRLFITSSYNTIFNFTDGSTEFLYTGAQTFHNRYWKNQETESVCLFADSVLVKSLETKSTVESFGLSAIPYDSLPASYKDSLNFFLGVRERAESLAFSYNDSLLYIGGSNGTLTAYATKTKRILFSRRIYDADDPLVRWIVVDSLNDRVLIHTASGKLCSLDAFSGKMLDSVSTEGSGFILTRDAVYVSGGDCILYKYDAKTLDLVKKITMKKGGIGAGIPALSPDQKHIALSAVDNNYLCLVNVDKDELEYCIYDHDFVGGLPAFSPDNKLVVTGGFDNRVNIYERATGKYLGSIHTPLDPEHVRSDEALRTSFSGYVLSDAEGHYVAPKKALDGIVFLYKNNAFNYEQFDLQFNRPDLVLASFGKADDAVIRSYNEAYKKRLKKLGLTEADVSIDVHLPITRILDRYNARPTTSANKYELTIECYDSKYQLQSLQVVVNNVPLFGSKGKMINGSKAVEKVEIPLSSGDNIIKVYCTNEKGARSLRSDFTVYSTYKPRSAKTYFIGIAVADYKDTSMSLTYSAKDVRDLANKFKQLYPDIIIDTLINKNATKQNILRMKDSLMKTSVNDKVFMAVTGHGLLSDSLDFYYGTYNVDFAKPEVNGLKYEDLENLLNDIPCRQKLLLIDACHSGALDKDELMKKGVIQKGNVKTKNTRSSIKVKKSKLNLNNTFELMQAQFADLSGSSGTIVISAAGGLEYAFESAKWNNGVFTYAVITTLDENKSLSVQQLQQEVSRKVKELTGGLQKPNSRKENLDYNWSIK